MFVLGLLCNLYGLDPALAREQIARIFGKKDEKVIKSNVALYEAGALWARPTSTSSTASRRASRPRRRS